MSIESISKDNCNHRKWTILREAGPVVSEGQGGKMYPAVFKCSKCKLIMTASEALQLSALKHLLGFQRWISVIALILSVIAIGISVIY